MMAPMRRVPLLPLSPPALALAALLGACGTEPATPSSEEGATADAPLTWPRAMAAASSSWRETRGLAQAPVRADAPRVARLLDDGTDVGFTALGEPPAPMEPIVVPLTAGPGVRHDDDTFVVAPKMLLTSAGDLGIPSGDVAELLVRVRVAQGTTLQIHFHPRRASEVPRVALPVEPSGEWQTLRIRQPLLMSHGGPDVVDRITLSADKDLGETLVLQIEPLRIAQARAVYTLGTHGARRIEVAGSLRPALWQSAAGQVHLPWPGATGGDAGPRAGGRAPAEGAIPHPGRRVTGSVAALPGPADAPATLEVALEEEAGEAHPLARLAVVPGEGWRDVTLDLPDGAAPSALLLRSVDLPRGTVLLHAGWRAIDTTRPPRRAVLLVMDTLRADALGAYGRPGDPTPALDRLAAGGARFSRCYSQAHWTRPSMPSIMTGLYVPATGVQSKFDQLSDAYETLPERFAAAGWRTLAFVANAQAGPAAGLGQGYDELVLCLGQDSDAQFREIVEPRLAALPDDDLLVYVHLMDPHGPYGPEQAPDGYAPIPGTPVEPDPKYDRRWTTSPTVESRVHYYHADVAVMDAAIGGFLERVVAPWERAGGAVPIVALSDHGEWLGEEGLWGHGKGLLRPEVVHTPLIVRAPGRIEPGTVVEDPVENLDAGATLLALADVALGDGVDAGRSLLARLRGGPPAPADRVAVSSNVSGKERHLTLWGPPGALVGENDAIAGTLQGTGAELRALDEPTRGEIGPTFSAFWSAFARTGAAIHAHHHARRTDDVSELDAASLEQLEQLGYLGY